MAELYTYNGTHLTTVRENSTEFTLSAELGAVGSGRFVIEDTAGTVAIVGQKDFAHTESSCASNLTFRGYIADRRYTREADPQVAASRNIEVTLSDLNDMLAFRLISGSDGKRPAETVAARGAWLMGSDYVTFDDNGRCSFSSAKGMDEADYRGQYPGDVLADMALAQGGVNYHVNDYGSGPELTFRDDNASTADSCALTISNDLTDSSSLHPFKDAVLTRSPANVYSKIAYAYAKGTVYEERTATATAFNGERGGTASNSNITTSAKASDEAETILWQHHTEADYIEVTVLATSAQVNLMPPGWRIQAKFTHLDTEGYGDFTWFRIIQVTRRPIVADGALYEVHLRLSPQEAAEPAATIVQRAFDRGISTRSLTLPNPVTIDSGSGTHVLVMLVVTRDDGTPGEPLDDGGSWTRLNGSNETSAEHDVGASGIAAYWKVADDTDNTFVRPDSSYWCAGVWELDGVDMASATLVTKDDQTSSADPVVMALGSLGSPATDEIVLAGWVVVNKADTSGFGDYRPILAVTANITERFWNGPVDFSYGVHPATYYPLAFFGDYEGSGSALNPTINRPSGLANPDGVDIADDVSAPTAWAGIGIKIPSA